MYLRYLYINIFPFSSSQSQCFHKTIGDDSQNCPRQVGRWLPWSSQRNRSGVSCQEEKGMQPPDGFPEDQNAMSLGNRLKSGAIRRSGWTWGRSQNFPMGRESFLWVGSVFRQSWKWNMTILETKLIFQGPDTTTWHHKLYFHTCTNSYFLYHCKGHPTSAFWGLTTSPCLVPSRMLPPPVFEMEMGRPGFAISVLRGVLKAVASGFIWCSV